MKINRFVDAHMHLWDLHHIRYPWLTPPFNSDGPNGSVEPIASDYLLENYFTDAQDIPVKKLVHIEAGAHPDDAVKETQWLQTLANRDNFPQAIVAYAALNNPDLEKLLEGHSEYKNLRGIRHIINWHPNPLLTYNRQNYLEDSAFHRGYRLLTKFNLSFDLQIYPNQMLQAYELAKLHPDTPLILNHMGMPVDLDKNEWKKGIQVLAQLSHASIKISGFGFINRHWQLPEMRELVLYTIEHFGTDRVMFASDYPTDKLFNSFAQAFNTYQQITENFSANEIEAMFAANAERIYRI